MVLGSGDEEALPDELEDKRRHTGDDTTEAPDTIEASCEWRARVEALQRTAQDGQAGLQQYTAWLQSSGIRQQLDALDAQLGEVFLSS